MPSRFAMMSGPPMKHALTFEGTSVIVEEPDGWDRSLAFILGHGAGQSMDSPFMSFFHAGLAELGFLSVKFNFQYMEQGRRAPDHQNKLRATYRGVIDLITERHTPEALLIGGKSMGGRVASYIAGEIPAVRGLVFLGYPLHPPGRTDKLRDEHLYDLNRDMLFISGTRDSLARPELLDRVVAKIGARARLVRIEGGDHSLRVKKSDEEPLAHALQSIGDWSRRF